MKELTQQSPLQRPQVIVRVVYHCPECDPFGSHYRDKSGVHGRKMVFETNPCSCQTKMCEQCWEAHGQEQPCNLGCGCHDAPIADPVSEQKLSNAVNRLRDEQSAVEQLIAGLDRDAEDATGRIKGVLSLCGRELTTSEAQRVRAQVRAELLSFLIKTNNAIGQEWFDMIAARQVRN